MTITKAYLIESLFRDIGLSKQESKEFVEVFFNEISQVLQDGCSLKFPGFGNFKVYDKTERVGRNPKTGVETPITARRVVVFHAGQKLKRRVKDYVYKSTLLKI